MTDHIPLPPPDHTEDVQGFVHDTQRHYYAEETMRAYAERLHAARVNGPATMQAIGLLAVLQSWIGPRRPESSEPEEQALWDQINATRIALTPLAPAAVAGPCEKWRERWHGSGGASGLEGWSIVSGRALIAYLGRGVSSEAVSAIVMAHNTSAPTTQVAPQPAVQQGDAEDAASWRALAQPTEETIMESMEASCAHRPSVDDDSYVLRILRVFTNAARSQAQQGGA